MRKQWWGFYIETQRGEIPLTILCDFIESMNAFLSVIGVCIVLIKVTLLLNLFGSMSVFRILNYHIYTDQLNQTRAPFKAPYIHIVDMYTLIII